VDQIVVLEHGRVVEQGRGPELVARGGVYAKLYASGHYPTCATLNTIGAWKTIGGLSQFRQTSNLAKGFIARPRKYFGFGATRKRVRSCWAITFLVTPDALLPSAKTAVARLAISPCSMAPSLWLMKESRLDRTV